MSQRPIAHAPAAVCLVAVAAATTLALATHASQRSGGEGHARAAPRTTLGCSGAITIADGAEIIGGMWGDVVTETVRVDVRCDDELPVRIRTRVGSWSCTNVPSTIEGAWQSFTETAMVRLTIGAAWWPQSVLVQVRTRDGVDSQVFCDDVVMHGHPPLDQTATPYPTQDPRTPTWTRTPTQVPIPTEKPSPTRTYGPSPTPSPGPTSTPRTATVHGRILLADGAATINGTLGAAIDVPLALDLTGAGAPLCLMRLRLSGGGCRDDIDGGLTGMPWQAFRHVVSLEVPLAQDAVTISAWAQVQTAAGNVSRAFCDDVRVHAPHTATPCGGSPTPRVSTPLPPVTPCPRWNAPVYLPAALRAGPPS